MPDDLFSRILELIRKDEVRASEHAFREMEKDDLSFAEVLAGISQAEVVEEYPEYHKGPCVLVLQKDNLGAPIHVLWGIPKDAASPAWLVTTYRPDSLRWINNFKTRAPKS